MRGIITYKLVYKFFVLTGLSLCLWVVSTRATKSTPQMDQFIPVMINEQLSAKDGVIPVEIRCGQARLTAPNRLEEFQCNLKNNTNANITAANVIYSIVLEQNGSLTKDTVSSTVEALVHTDFKGTNKLIGPNDESAVGPPGPISYENSVIKGVEIGIDYVEFENGTTLGPDKQGSQIIRAMRAGAEKYKAWVRVQYNQNGKSVAAIFSLVENDQLRPSELRFVNANEELGANAYRNRLRKLFQTRGPDEVNKIFKTN